MLFQKRLVHTNLDFYVVIYIPCRGGTKIGKNMIFWRKIAFFLHEIPQKLSRLPPLGAILFNCGP